MAPDFSRNCEKRSSRWLEEANRTCPSPNWIDFLTSPSVTCRNPVARASENSWNRFGSVVDRISPSRATRPGTPVARPCGDGEEDRDEEAERFMIRKCSVRSGPRQPALAPVQTQAPCVDEGRGLSVVLRSRHVLHSIALSMRAAAAEAEGPSPVSRVLPAWPAACWKASRAAWGFP